MGTIESLFNEPVGEEELDRIKSRIDPLLLVIVFNWNKLRSARCFRKIFSVEDVFKLRLKVALFKFGRLKLPKFKNSPLGWAEIKFSRILK